MTKLKEQFKEIFRFVGLRENELNHIAEQCAEITEQECIGFKKFCDKSFLIRTYEEMYQLYQKSKEKL